MNIKKLKIAMYEIVMLISLVTIMTVGSYVICTLAGMDIESRPVEVFRDSALVAFILKMLSII